MNNNNQELKDISNYADILAKENKEFKTQIEVLRKENHVLEARNNNLFYTSLSGYLVIGLLGVWMLLVAKFKFRKK